MIIFNSCVKIPENMCEMFVCTQTHLACLLGFIVPNSPALQRKRALHALQLPWRYFRFLPMRAQHYLMYSKTSSRVVTYRYVNWSAFPSYGPHLCWSFLLLKSRSGPICAQTFLFWSLFLLLESLFGRFESQVFCWVRNDPILNSNFSLGA